MLTHFFSSLAAVMFSWLVGLLLVNYLKKQSWYRSLSNLQFISNQVVYAAIGIKPFKWLVTKTAYRHLNYNLKLSARPGLEELRAVRNAMTDSEVLHLIAFILIIVAGIPGFILWGIGFSWAWLFGLNCILNLYPTLLQQSNKAKLDKVIFYLEQKNAHQTVASI